MEKLEDPEVFDLVIKYLNEGVKFKDIYNAYEVDQNTLNRFRVRYEHLTPNRQAPKSMYRKKPEKPKIGVLRRPAPAPSKLREDNLSKLKNSIEKTRRLTFIN